MHFEKFITKEYNTYSIYEKIDLLLTLHNIFNSMIESTEGMRKIRDLNLFEENVLDLELLNLRNDIYRCENEINKIRKDTNNKDILEKIETAQINRTLNEIIENDHISDDLIQTLKRRLLSIHIYCLQINELEKRKRASLISEKEKEILPKIIEKLQIEITVHYHELDYKEQWEIPINFRYRREIIDAIEDSQIEASKVLPPQISCISVNYLKDEEYKNIDLRKWGAIDWLRKRYDIFRSSRYPFLNPNYKFNFQVLYKDLPRYSFRKQIEVGLAFYNSNKIQMEALMKWRKQRQNLNAYEELIYQSDATGYKKELYKLERKILEICYVDIEEYHYYSCETFKKIADKISAANLNLGTYYKEEIEGERSKIKMDTQTAENYSKAVYDHKNLGDEYQIKYNSLSCSFDPGHMSGYAYIEPSNIYDPNRAEFIRFLIAKHTIKTVECDALLKSIGKLKGYEKRYENILIRSLCVYKTHHVLLTDEEIWDKFSMLPDDYPDKQKIFKEIKKAKVSLNPEEIVRKKNPKKELHNYNAYPGSKGLFKHDEPPKKPVEYFKKEEPESSEKSPS